MCLRLGPTLTFCLPPFVPSLLHEEKKSLGCWNTKCFTFCYHKCQAFIHFARCIVVYMRDNDTVFFTFFPHSLCHSLLNVPFCSIYFRHEFANIVSNLSSKLEWYSIFTYIVHQKCLFIPSKTKTEGRNFVNERNSANDVTKKQTYTHTRARTHKVFYLLPLNWIYDVMQNENKTTCDKWVHKRETVLSPKRNVEAKWCEEENVCACVWCAFIYRCKLCIIVAIEIGSVRSLHFILFMIRRRVWRNILRRKNIHLLIQMNFNRNGFNIARHLYAGYELDKANTHTWKLRNAHVDEHTHTNTKHNYNV